MKRKKFSFFGFLLFIFLVSSLYAQEAKINMENIGFGKTFQDARFNVYNTGEVYLTNVTFYVDGREYKTIYGLSTPGDGFVTTLYLQPGKHLVEIKTPEGAYDSLEITIFSVKEKSFQIIEEPSEFEEFDVTWIVAIILVIIIVVVVWLLIKKPKLEKKK